MTGVIWVIDDQGPVAESLTLLLMSNGLPARAYTSAKTVLAELEAGKVPAAMILDICMPFNGVTLLEKLLSNSAWTFPVIVESGSEDGVPKRFSGRVWATFSKPIDPLGFVECVKRLVGVK